MYGLTDSGFSIKRLPIIKEEIEANLRNRINQNIDLRAESLFGQFVGLESELATIFWEVLQDIYLSQYPDYATGNSLDYAVSINGVTRIEATPTSVNAVCYGTSGTILAAGREAKAKNGDVYRTNTNTTITRLNAVECTISVDTVGIGNYTIQVGELSYTYTATGTDIAQDIIQGLYDAMALAPLTRILQDDTLVIKVSSGIVFDVSANLNIDEVGTVVFFEAIEKGAKLLPIGELNEIETPVFGWNRVINLVDGIIGKNRETDEALRIRREQSILITATHTLQAIKSKVRQLDNVADVFALENNTDSTDSFGTPRQFIWIIVEGGEDLEIATAIYNTVAGGIGTRGNQNITVQDEDGQDYIINFDRPTYIDVNIEIEYVRLENFPNNGEDLIKDALVNRGNQYLINEDLIYSRLYTPINSVQGVQVDSLKVNNAMSNIVTLPNEKIRILRENITLIDVTV